MEINIEEGNILIAEYEGRVFQAYKDNKSYNAKFSTYKSCMDFINEHNFKGYLPELGWGLGCGQYHARWDWLMPVIEKITKEQYDDNGRMFDPNDHYYLRTFGMYNDQGQIMARINRCPVFAADTLIEASWLAVVDWIKIHAVKNA